MFLVLLGPPASGAQEPTATSRPWLTATAYAIPKETANQGEGYFSIVEGKNGRLYVGTAAHGVNSFLVEFDPAAEAMRVVVDAHNEIGTNATGFAAQSKIHSRNNTGPSGKIYFGTKQGYPEGDEQRTDYPGGYPMVYDPATATTRVYPIPIEHQGIISVTPDESRGLAYISTCSDERPIESTYFLKLDLESGEYTDLMDCRHMYAFIVVDHRGRAYHPILGGQIARYDPNTNRLDRLSQTINGQPPTAKSNLAHPESHPINWDITPDGKTLYAVAMSVNRLFSYDLTVDGDTLPGRDLGAILPGAESTDCRAMCVGPTGEVWIGVTTPDAEIGGSRTHLVSYRAGEAAPRDRGPVAIANPDYTDFHDAQGNDLPFHHGIARLADGTATPKHSIMGVCEGRDGSVYLLSMAPYTLLRVPPDRLDSSDN